MWTSIHNQWQVRRSHRDCTAIVYLLQNSPSHPPPTQHNLLVHASSSSSPSLWIRLSLFVPPTIHLQRPPPANIRITTQNTPVVNDAAHVGLHHTTSNQLRSPSLARNNQGAHQRLHSQNSSLPRHNHALRRIRPQMMHRHLHQLVALANQATHRPLRNHNCYLLPSLIRHPPVRQEA